MLFQVGQVILSCPLWIRGKLRVGAQVDFLGEFSQRFPYRMLRAKICRLKYAFIVNTMELGGLVPCLSFSVAPVADKECDPGTYH